MTSPPPVISIRPLVRADIPAALDIQSHAYPAFLHEHEAAFVSRLDIEPTYCLAATRDGVPIAYLLAHGWPSQAPPPIGKILTTPTKSEVLFIHDLAVSPLGNGLRIGRQLVMHALKLAARDGLNRAELIAVEGAASYWRTLDFVEDTSSPALAAKVASYGPDARWMARPI